MGGGTALYYPPTQPAELTEMPPQAHTTPVQMSQLGLHQINIYGQPITDAQVAQARLYKQGHRPLGRTQSAPLPLGHPMLAGTVGVTLGGQPSHFERYDVSDGIDLSTGEAKQTRNSHFQAERQLYEQRHLLQKIRHTVLTRGREPQLKEEEAAEVNYMKFFQ